MLSETEKAWRELTRGDVVGELRKAGLPCIGIRNYAPVLEDGSTPDIERVREILSTNNHTLGTEKSAAPTFKKGRGRPKGSKNRRK